MLRKRFENPELRRTLVALERAGRRKKLWRRTAEILSKSRRKRVAVNLSKISKLCEEDSTVIVPGKVLGVGSVNKKITVVSFSISALARKKIENAGGRVLLLRPNNIDDKLLKKPVIIT